MSLRPGISLPPKVTIPLPFASSAGACICTDPRGTHRYVYVLGSLAGVTIFGRIDAYSGVWQRLAAPPAGLTFGAGCAMVFDPSRGNAGRVWVFGPGAGGGVDAWWHHFDVDTLAWDVGGAPDVASLNALLGATWGTDASLAHPCTDVAAAASDDLLYLSGNGGVANYRFSIGGDVWTSVPPANRAVAGGAGVSQAWLWGYDPDAVWSTDGGGVATEEIYTIAGNAWNAYTAVPAWIVDLPGAGTGACTSPDGTRWYTYLGGTGRIYELDPRTNARRPVAGIIGLDGAGVVGNRVCALLEGTTEHIVVWPSGSDRIQRITPVRG